MKRAAVFRLLLVLLFATGILTWRLTSRAPNDDARFIWYIADTKKQDVQLYWKDDRNEIFRSIRKLKLWLERDGKRLVFAMNAGMYRKDNLPQGLLIIKSITLSSLDTLNGKGNFYLPPNGVFYLTTDHVPVICQRPAFVDDGKVEYATQSGPMLVVNGHINPVFRAGSANLNIRNGVGILPDKKVVFVMSKSEVSFYEFASYFKRLGCKNALYLDGFVSRMYLPEKQWTQTDGDFGAMIAITASRP